MAWVPVSILPNVAIEAPIDGDLIALASSDDPRVIVIKRAYPSFYEFLESFSDAFQVPIRPSVILVRDDAPRSVYS